MHRYSTQYTACSDKADVTKACVQCTVMYDTITYNSVCPILTYTSDTDVGNFKIIMEIQNINIDTPNEEN
jgi:hypothetical protein